MIKSSGQKIIYAKTCSSISNNLPHTGAGYHMVMTKRSDCDVDLVHQLLTKHIPEAKLESKSCRHSHDSR